MRERAAPVFGEKDALAASFQRRQSYGRTLTKALCFMACTVAYQSWKAAVKFFGVPKNVVFVRGKRDLSLMLLELIKHDSWSRFSRWKSASGCRLAQGSYVWAQQMILLKNIFFFFQSLQTMWAYPFFEFLKVWVWWLWNVSLLIKSYSGPDWTGKVWSTKSASNWSLTGETGVCWNGDQRSKGEVSRTMGCL